MHLMLKNNSIEVSLTETIFINQVPNEYSGLVLSVFIFFPSVALLLFNASVPETIHLHIGKEYVILYFYTQLNLIQCLLCKGFKILF